MTGVEEIREILPHRYPMLLVDRVLEVRPGESIRAVKAVSVNEPWYQTLAVGSAYPPVLLVESWCQAAGVMVAWDERNPDVLAGTVMLFGSITGVRFHRPVFPGDVVEHRVRLGRRLADSALVEGEAFVGDEPVMTVERVVMAWRPAEALRPSEYASDSEDRSVHV